MDGTLVLHILLVIIFFLAVLACRMYCRKRNKHKSLRFMIARIHPLRVTPVLHPPYPPLAETIRRTMSSQLDESLGEYLPGTTCPNSADPSAPPELLNEREDQEDQISLESRTISTENNIRTADDVKSPPPPYSAGARDLPSYEEAIRFSKGKGETETINNT